jgi:hypothetical protein
MANLCADHRTGLVTAVWPGRPFCHQAPEKEPRSKGLPLPQGRPREGETKTQRFKEKGVHEELHQEIGGLYRVAVLKSLVYLEPRLRRGSA